MYICRSCVYTCVEGDQGGQQQYPHEEVLRQRALLTCPRSPLQDSRLFRPSPWKVLATTYETNDF